MREVMEQGESRRGTGKRLKRKEMVGGERDGSKDGSKDGREKREKK